MSQTGTWRTAYDYPHWRTASERRAFADYYAITQGCTSRAQIDLANHYGDWLFQQ